MNHNPPDPIVQAIAAALDTLLRYLDEDLTLDIADDDVEAAIRNGHIALDDWHRWRLERDGQLPLAL